MSNEIECKVSPGHCPFPGFSCDGCRYKGRYKKPDKNDPNEISRYIDKCVQKESILIEILTKLK